MSRHDNGFSNWVPWALALTVLALLVGTQMPGAWRNAALDAAGLPWQATTLAHLLAFGLMAWLSQQPPLRWSLWRLAALVVALAVGTELLQFWARDRHPGLDDVAVDLAGAVLGAWWARRSRGEDKKT